MERRSPERHDGVQASAGRGAGLETGAPYSRRLMERRSPERHDGVAGQCGSRCRSGDRRSILPPPYGTPLSRAARWSTGQCGSRCRSGDRRSILPPPYGAPLSRAARWSTGQCGSRCRSGDRRSIPSEARSAERAGEGAALEGSWDFIRAVPTDPRPPPRPARHYRSRIVSQASQAEVSERMISSPSARPSSTSIRFTEPRPSRTGTLSAAAPSGVIRNRPTVLPGCP